MPLLHLANAYFEEELEQGAFPSPQYGIQKNRIYRALQWLPFLYAPPEDYILITEAPPESLFEDFPPFARAQPHLFSDRKLPPYSEIVSWGASPSVGSWAAKRGAFYPHPDWDLVRTVNSKAFSFENTPQLPGSALLHTFEAVERWAQNNPATPTVLKTSFGLSGKGHLLLPQHRGRLQAFAQQGLLSAPLIAEPWVNRIADFSTQWEILQQGEIRYVGETVCLNDHKGCYKATQVGDFPFPLWLKEHREIAFPILKKMQNLGYFGNIGIDAMLYQTEKGKVCLHPIVEINARKTMGWVALMIQQRHTPHQPLAFSFSLNGNQPVAKLYH